MTAMMQIYKCEICGNIVEVLHTGMGELVCCGQPMKLMPEQTADWKTEKHVPVVEKVDDGYKVIVGSTIHPMTAEHHIEWIQLITKSKSLRKFLKPGDAPEARFTTDCEAVSVREYCNIHDLWRK